MSNKIKSLIYLSCFVLAAIIYNGTITEETEQFADNQEFVDADIVIEPFSENTDQTQTK